jgi:hypothetical protein
VAREVNGTDSVRIYIRTSAEIAAYLEELVRIGVHGKTPSEVAKTLVGYEVERLIRERFLELRRPT